MGEKFGQSGVELTEIRDKVSAWEGGPVAGEKPKNNYLEFDRKSRQKSGQRFSGARSMSCGFGPGKLQSKLLDESMPKLDESQVAMLLLIDSGATLKEKEDACARSLEKLGLIIWMGSQNRYGAMADGRRVAEALRDNKH